MKPIIEIVISPQGDIKLETRGFTGPGCQEASRYLEQTLGMKASERLTSGFYQTPPVASVVPQRVGE